MKKRTLFSCIVMLLIAMFSLSACGGNSENSAESGSNGDTYNLRLATMYAVDHPDTQSCQRAADKIAEQTGGKVTITVYPSNQLGDYTQVYSELMSGTIDMAAVTVTGQYDPRLEINCIPYLVSSYEEARTVFSNDSEFYALFDSIQQELGVKTLGFYQDGFMGMGGTDFDLDTVMDFNVDKNQVMRIPPMEVYKIMAEDLGFRTTSIAYSELYSALETGVADGWFGGAPLINYTDFRDAIQYYVYNQYIHDLIVVCMNLNCFEGMPQEYQDIIIDVFAEETLNGSIEREDLDAQALDDMEAYGITVYRPSQEEIDAAAAHIREVSWPKYEEIFGKETMDAVKQAIGYEG